uniref:CX domain-containing protein n=1 Tax=Panagrellus redivivus TaxID=6233 RepID=A0A7E4V586_PANRE
MGVWHTVSTFPAESLLKFDSSFTYDMSTSSSGPNYSPRMSFWSSTSNTEPSESEQMALRNRNIVHLAARPLQIYYHDDDSISDNVSQLLPAGVCRITVQTREIYTTLETDDATVDLLFLCSGSCCGLDCCHVNITLIVALSCICIAILGFAGYFIAALIADFKLARKVLPCLFVGKRSHGIRRANATRKQIHRGHQAIAGVKRHSQASTFPTDSNFEAAPTRKKSKSMNYTATARKSIAGEEILSKTDRFPVELSRGTSKIVNYKHCVFKEDMF